MRYSMKFLVINIFIFLVTLINVYSQYNKQLAPLSTLMKKNELTERYLKLGNTYREAKQFDISLEYLNKGLVSAQNNNNIYWTAVGYEFKGYLYRDNSDLKSAKEYLEKAKYIFEKIIKMKRGSNEAIDMVIQDLSKKNISSIKSNSEPSSNPLEVSKLKKDIEEYKLRISSLEIENSELKEKTRIYSERPSESKPSRTEVKPEKKELEISDGKLVNEKTMTTINNKSNPNKDKNDDNLSDINSEKLPLKAPTTIDVESNPIKENQNNKGENRPKRPALPKPISDPK